MITKNTEVKCLNDDKTYIVKDLRSGGKALIQSTDGEDYYLVPVDDLEVVGCD